MAATFIRAADAPRFEVHGAQVIGYASPARGSGSVATWRLVLLPGTGSPVHQLSVDETFIVLRGAADYEVPERTVRVGPGDGITVQANTPFRILAAGTSPSRRSRASLAGARRAWRGESPSPRPGRRCGRALLLRRAPACRAELARRPPPARDDHP